MNNNRLRVLSIVVAVLLVISLLYGCGTKESVIGSWEFVSVGATFGYKTYEFTLYEDGKCMGSPVSCPGGTEAVSYKLESDGTLFFYDQWNGQTTVLRTDDIEQARMDADYYYQSGDTMVIYTCTYQRKQ